MLQQAKVPRGLPTQDQQGQEVKVNPLVLKEVLRVSKWQRGQNLQSLAISDKKRMACVCDIKKKKRLISILNSYKSI